MDGKGRALDNIFTERLWRTIKYENIYLMDYLTNAQTLEGLSDYLNFYNNPTSSILKLSHPGPTLFFFFRWPGAWSRLKEKEAIMLIRSEHYS